jgi:P-type E1-E2 ATPase
MLQEDVQKCITDFKDAGIRVWMLTGDSGRTAREIGIQCGIIRPT